MPSLYRQGLFLQRMPLVLVPELCSMALDYGSLWQSSLNFRYCLDFTLTVGAQRLKVSCRACYPLEIAPSLVSCVVALSLRQYVDRSVASRPPNPVQPLRSLTVAPGWCFI